MPNRLNNKKVICVIPARLHSTRFPKKILTKLQNKTLLQWSFEAASKIKLFDNVAIALDSQETTNIVKTFNAPYITTSKECSSGTARLIEVMQSKQIEGDIWVNWQADEPFINPEMINELLQTSHLNDADVWTLKKEIHLEHEIDSPNIVKVVCNAKNEALLFSRSTIPYYRDTTDKKYFKHIGIYAYTTESLKSIANMPQCHLEQAERLEQLKFLYYGLKIKVHTTKHETIGIDTLEDLAEAELFLKTQNNTRIV